MGTGGPCRGPEPVSRKVPGRCRERHSREFFCAVTRRLGGCAAPVADFFAIFITRTEPSDDRLGRLGRLERADLPLEVPNPMTPDSAGRGWKWTEVRSWTCREWPEGMWPKVPGMVGRALPGWRSLLMRLTAAPGRRFLPGIAARQRPMLSLAEAYGVPRPFSPRPF